MLLSFLLLSLFVSEEHTYLMLHFCPPFVDFCLLSFSLSLLSFSGAPGGKYFSHKLSGACLLLLDLGKAWGWPSLLSVLGRKLRVT